MSEWFLSRVELNVALRGAQKLLRSPEAMHAAVLSCFPRSAAEDLGRVLWRTDSFNGSSYVLIQSSRRPDLSVIEKQAGWLGAESSGIKGLDSLLDSLHEGQVLRFMLRANPVRSVMPEGESLGKRGKVIAHVTVEHQLDWLTSRADKLGVAFQADGLGTVQVAERGTYRFRKAGAGRPVRLAFADFRGALSVSDTAAFRRSILNGVGRGKAYGLGMWALAPVGRV